MNKFKQILDRVNSGTKVPALSLVKSSPEIAATLAKMVASRVTPQMDNNGNRTIPNPDINTMRTIAEARARDAIDAATVQEVLPETENAVQVLISSILSPKDMVTTTINHSVSDSLMAHEVTAALLTEVRTHFDTDYKIVPLLSKILRDMLFNTGSYALAVLPENTIDEIINGQSKLSYESISNEFDSNGIPASLGLLGLGLPAINPENVIKQGYSFKATFENLSTGFKKINNNSAVIDSIEGSNTPLLTVTDNFNVLKLPGIQNRIREETVFKSLGRSSALEAISPNYNDAKISGLVYRHRNFAYNPITVLKHNDQLNRRTVGNPLVVHFPSECVLPVFVPGSPEKQVGFFVLVDSLGRPLSLADDPDNYQQMQQKLSANSSYPSAMLQKVKLQMDGTTNIDPTKNFINQYATFIENDLLERLRNGAYGKEVSIAKQEDIYRIMLQRALAEKHTQVLFVPVELMTYFAFKYDKRGIGISYLDSLKILNSLRAMLMFSNIMTSLKNSIGRTEVKVKLDPLDPDPKKAIEIAMSEIIRSRQQYFPLGVNSPTDIVDYLQRAGYEFTFEGHPGLPDVGIDFGEKNSTYTKPDTELEESLRKRFYQGIGVPPELVDQTFSPEFATNILSNNLIMAKNALKLQEIFSPQITDHLRKIIINSEKLINKLKKIITDNFEKLEKELVLTEEGERILASKETEDVALKDKAKEEAINSFLYEFVASYTASLPAPNSVTLDNQLKALQSYIELLDVAVEAWVNEKFITTENSGDISNYAIVIKEMIRSYFIRQWLVENGVMPELSAITNIDENGNLELDILEFQRKHIDEINKATLVTMTRMSAVKEILNEKIQELGPVDNSGGDSESETTDDNSGGQETGFDPFGGGEDTGTETSDTPEPEAEAEPKEKPKANEETPPEPDATEQE